MQFRPITAPSAKRSQLVVLAAGLVFVVGCSTSAPKAQSVPVTAANVSSEQIPEQESPDAMPDEWPMMAMSAVAIVDGVEIPAADFNKEVDRLTRIAPNLPPQVLQKFKNTTVVRLIDQNLVEKALSTENITAEPAEIEDELAQFSETVGGPEGAKEFFDKVGVTDQEVREDLGRAVRLKKYLKRKYAIEVTDEDAKIFYGKNLEDFTDEETIRARHILLKVDSDTSEAEANAQEEKAKKIFKKAKAEGADFTALANEFSEDVNLPGGDLGFFPRKQMVSAFSDAAFAATTGDVIGPIKTEFGYHIIEVTDRRPAETKPFYEVKAEIIRSLERGKLRDGMAVLVKELRAKSKIENLTATAIQDNPNFKPPN